MQHNQLVMYDGNFSALARGEAKRERRWKEGAWGDSGRKGAGRWTGAPELPIYELRITIWRIPRRWRNLVERMRSGIFGYGSV